MDDFKSGNHERRKMAEILRRSEQELHALSKELFDMQETERKRISAELHDGIGQYLSAVKYSLEQHIHTAHTESADQSQRHLQRTLGLLQQAIEEVRALAVDLRPAVLDDLGLLAAISWFCRRFQKAHATPSITTQIGVVEPDVPAPLRIVVYRILQEAAANVVKHAGAERLRISLEKQNGELLLSIDDDGCGFDVAALGAETGTPPAIGLIRMRERTELSGGAFQVRSCPGAGTRVRASWPITKFKRSNRAAAIS